MRVQLNFRDTHINYDNGIYTLNFNISKYVKLQQLSNNARCYIESVNLLDVSPAGITHRLEGSFDIHANFINNDDINDIFLKEDKIDTIDWIYEKKIDI